MNRETLNSLLSGALVVCLVLSGWFALRYHFQKREYRRLAAEFGVANSAHVRAQMLIGAAAEYAKTNQSIDPVLKIMNISGEQIRANNQKSK